MRDSIWRDLWPLWVMLFGLFALFVFGAWVGDPARDRCRERGGHYVKMSDGYMCVKGLEVWK